MKNVVKCGLALFALNIAPVGAFAQSLNFEADSEILIVRIRQVADTVRAEIIAPRGGVLQCVAFDENQDPLAVAMTPAELGSARFPDLDASDVESVACKYVEGF